jgi:hypothetical protein
MAFQIPLTRFTGAEKVQNSQIFDTDIFHGHSSFSYYVYENVIGANKFCSKYPLIFVLIWFAVQKDLEWDISLVYISLMQDGDVTTVDIDHVTCAFCISDRRANRLAG